MWEQQANRWGQMSELGETLGDWLFEKKDALFFLLDGGVSGKKEFCCTWNRNTAHLDEKQLIVPETGVDYLGS